MGVATVPLPPEGERRFHDRRRVRRRELDPGPAGGLFKRSWVPRSWPVVVIIMTLALFVCIVVTASLPPVAAALPLGLAVLTGAGMQVAFMAIGECDGRRMAKYSAIGLTIVLPNLLYGFGLTAWVSSGGLTWPVAIAVMACLGTSAAICLRRFPTLIYTVSASLWLPAIIAFPNWSALAALALAMLITLVVAKRQAVIDRYEAQQLAAIDRLRQRAQDILIDYEETGQGWFWETDRRAQLTYLSEPVARMLGRSSDDLIGRPLTDIFDLGDYGQTEERTLMFHLAARSSFHELPVRAAIVGEERWWSISGRPTFDEQHNFTGFRGSGTDLTEKQRSQQWTTRLAHYDSLTGLANRFQLSQSLEKILSMPHQTDRCCAFLLLDLDRFKQVNDTLGHPAGDALLKQVASRLEDTAGRIGQTGRLGGDEFALIIPGQVERQSLAVLAEQIIRVLSEPYIVEGQRVVIGASIGIACSPQDGATRDTLVRNADLALYAAKDAGRGGYYFYETDLHAEAEARTALEQDLRSAISSGELQLFYQPVVSVATEEITGFEALLRWKHREHGWISPRTFVPLAEEKGLITLIGEWALMTACHDLAKWPENIRVAVNVSPLQFANANLPSIVMNAVAQAGIDPSRLELEITESVFLNDDGEAAAMFATLKRIGVRLVLDDFGTGYSSLSHIERAPFDRIKIDQSFVRGATHEGSRNGAIISSITSLAVALGMETTAEGVETFDELELVRRYGCSHVQGFIYEPALSPEAALQRLAGGLNAMAQGKRVARSPRESVLCRVVLEHGGQRYNATIRNISRNGALIEGLWNVPANTVFDLQFPEGLRVEAQARWCQEDKMGVEFGRPVERDGNRPAFVDGAPPDVPQGTAAIRAAG
ncbi:EAL domain-containing protein [Altericroceibacterium spongiae]|uniref:EAL domain-containing protein n=2 Tax=Altericroceibacterium spongiae TaxID=2320269 RepID=A0A420EFJ3_9SPHN|nr:EAL domain-containing protein [Altericroceibacterium spongiae]